MKRPAVLISILLLAITTPPQSSAAAGPSSGRNENLIFAPQLAMAKFQAERGAFGDALETLEPAMKDDAFVQMPPDRAYEVATLYSAAAYNLGEWAAAHRAIVLATRQPQSTLHDWNQRFDTAVLAGDGPDAFATFQRLIGHSPFYSFSGRQLDRFDRLLGTLPNAREARLAMGREMERENWEAPYVHYDPSRVWLDYVEALQEAGDAAKAKAVAAKRIADPAVIMAMQADNRFDRLIAATPSLQNADAAAERYLAWARDYARDNPRMLSGRIALARALFILNRPSEALPGLDEADVAIGRGPRRREAFDDMSEESVLQYWRSASLISVGRVDEGIGARMAAAACHCSGLDALQLARALLDAGRTAEAQHWLDGLSEDGFGLEDRMTLAETRVCVASERGKPGDAATELAFLIAHEAWAPEALVGGLICAGDLDGAAVAVTRQLGDPQLRLDALAGLQAYAAEPAPRTHAAKLRTGWAKLAARPDVRAAVARVGRFKSFGLQRRDAIG